MSSPDDPFWREVRNEQEIASPALLVYPERVERNIRTILGIMGGPERLRPHVKTHKCPEVLLMQSAHGITKFKCATVAEAEMCAQCGAPDILLAYQPLGPNVIRLMELAKKFPNSKFSTIADDADALGALSIAAVKAGVQMEVFLDVDCGMHRTGIAPGPKAVDLYRLINTLPGLKPGGLHAYDGHIHDTDEDVRVAASMKAFAPVDKLRDLLLAADLPVPRMVAGGSPTFLAHVRRPGEECSPGTFVFWDFGYNKKFPEMPFVPAALLLTRIVSKPASNRLCLDLGHKAVASENPHPRVWFDKLPDAKFVGHSEEHLVIETDRAAEFQVGACLYGVPWHICPTVALHSEAVVVRNGRAEERWRIVARDRKLTV